MKHSIATKKEYIPTGIFVLDRNLNGGIPSGSFVCVYANPLAMPEVFLYHFASVTKSYYINTSRPSKYIKLDMERNSIPTDNVTFVDIYTQYYFSESGQLIFEHSKYKDKEVFDLVDDVLSKVDDAVVIVDSLSFFLKLNIESSFKEWLINRLYNFAKEKDTVVYSYVIKDFHTEDVVKKILDVSDVVLDITIERSGERFINKFAVPKIRGRRAILDYFRFYVEEGVRIDTSKDIA
ncbi:MAG: RAD55 family ATPase [Archaeoglobaceae archaeon]|nr:RAD55 family ATPase [Archaeoglobaceae archaeon]MCX8151759.1 RAD55 family ATPase [Archaeoglobaceae archaeon]MDW8014271.1 RAD55 family ATPase [Archaeoglobaceae archaeon]